MNKKLAVFFQAIVVLIGIVTLVALIRFPLIEGRAAKLDLLSIYSDKFILYGYAISLVFFLALFHVFTLLAFVKQNMLYSAGSVKAVKNIKYCAVVFCFCILAAGVFIKLTHDKADDPTGFLAVCAFFAFVSVLVALVAKNGEKKLRAGFCLGSGGDDR